MSNQLDILEGIIPLSSFRQSSKAHLQKINKTNKALILTQNGKSAAVLLTPQAYQKLEYERELFKAIAEGEKDIEEGNTVSHEVLFKELLP